MNAPEEYPLANDPRDLIEVDEAALTELLEVLLVIEERMVTSPAASGLRRCRTPTRRRMLKNDDNIRVVESAKDVFGVEIRAGDLVLHCVTSGRSAVLTCSRVREVRECYGSAYDPTQRKHVEAWRPFLAVEKLNGKKTTVGFLSRVVRAPDGWTPPEGDDWRFA